MPNLMSKTKKELVAMIEEMEKLAAAQQKAREKSSPMKEQLSDLQAELDKLRQKHVDLANQNQVLKTLEVSLKKKISQLESQSDKILDERRQALEERDRLLEERNKAEVEKQICQDGLLDAVSGLHKRVLLLDQNLTVLYANSPASELLNSCGCQEPVGISALDLFVGENSLKVKEKFTKVLLDGKKRKLKKMNLSGTGPGFESLKIKVDKTMLDQEPGLLLEIKIND